MSRFELILLCLCMGACTASVPPDPLAEAGLGGSGFVLVRTPQQFNDQVVGHHLTGSGFRAQIRPGGGLTGLYVGQAFEGRWRFADGIYCQSLTQDFSGPSYGCFHVAVQGDDIRLLPLD